MKSGEFLEDDPHEGQVEIEVEDDNGGPTPAQQKALDALREEWGEQFDANLQAAKTALREHGGDDMLALLEETGLGDDPRMIRAWARIGIGEAKNGERPSGGDLGQLTPEQAASAEQAKREITAVMNDMKNPYFNPTHPRHAEAKEKVRKLFEIAHPSHGVAFTL